MKRIWTALALLALATASTGKQDIDEEQALEDVHTRMLELMGKVETRLKTIDELLNDAAACQKKDNAAGEVGKFLETSRGSAQQNLDDIDEILRLSLHPHSCAGGGSCCKEGAGLCRGPKKAGSSGSSQQANASNSPSQGDQDGRVKKALDKNGETTSQRESTPDAQQPGDQKQGEKPGDKLGGKAQDGKKPGDKDNGDPNNPFASKSDPKNRASGAPRTAAAGGVSTADGADRWGDLPVYARDVFRAQGGDALPMRYRDFIDTYYKRLNEQK